MRHRKVERAISLLARQDWTPAVRKHFGACPRCQAFEREDAQLRTLLRARGGYTSDEQTALRMRSAIDERLVSAGEQRGFPAVPALPAWPLLRAAALVGVAAAGFFFLARNALQREEGWRPAEVAQPAGPSTEPAAPVWVLPATQSPSFPAPATTHRWQQAEQPWNTPLRAQPQMVDYQP